jgi:organic radical activating enzyme
MNTEQKFTEIVEKFKKEAIAIVTETITDLHCEWLPYVESDTEQNVNCRSQEVMQKIIEGNFTIDNNVIIVPSNNINCRINIPTIGWHTTMLNNIVKSMPACPKDLKIKNLEDY